MMGSNSKTNSGQFSIVKAALENMMAKALRERAEDLTENIKNGTNSSAVLGPLVQSSNSFLRKIVVDCKSPEDKLAVLNIVSKIK